MSPWRVGVDSGGTFTDVCMFDAEARPDRGVEGAATPHDPSLGIAGGVEQGLAGSFEAAGGRGRYLGHGTTVATNALLERRGVRTGVITTAGFRDLLEFGRQTRPDLYDLQADKPPARAARHRFEVPERVRHDGRSLEAARRGRRCAPRRASCARTASRPSPSASSTASPPGARAARRRDRARGDSRGVHLRSRIEVAPEFREYERLSTTVVNAYLGPVMSRYSRRSAERLAATRHPATPHHAVERRGDRRSRRRGAGAHGPLGPAAGVVGAQQVGGARRLRRHHHLRHGRHHHRRRAGRRAAGRAAPAKPAVHGYPIKAPMLDIHTVGAGGGSIAWIDAGGHLKVGPRSAGADPGPVCYGRGGDRSRPSPTPTSRCSPQPDASARRPHADRRQDGRARRSRGSPSALGLRRDGDRAGHHLRSSPPTWRGRSG